MEGEHSEPLLQPATDAAAEDVEAPGSASGSAVVVRLTPDKGLLIIEDDPITADTFWPCTFNLSKANLGASMMAIPRAFSLLGILLGTFLLTCVGFLTWFTLAGLIRAAERHRKNTYGSVVDAACGTPARVVLQLSVFLTCGGFMIVFLVVMADILVGQPPDFMGVLCEILGMHTGVWWLRRWFILLVVVIMLAPLVSQRDMSRLAPLNLVGMASAAILALLSCALAVQSVALHKARKIYWFPDMDTLGNTPVAVTVTLASIVPVLLSSNVCHQSVFPLLDMLKPYTRARMNRMTGTSLLIVNALYLTCAVCLWVAFGDDIDADVLNNLTVRCLEPLIGPVPAAVFAYTVRLGFFCSLVGSYVLLMWPFRACAFEIFFGRADIPSARLPATYLTLALSYACAVFLKSIWGIIVTIGSSASVLMAFVFPAWVILRSGGDGSLKWRCQQALAVFLISIGLALFVNCITLYVIGSS